MRLRALAAALGAACAAVAAVVALGSGSAPAEAAPLLVELRPTAHCDAAELMRAAGATTVSSSLRLYRVDGAAARKALPGIRACHALRFTSPDRRVGALSVTDFSDPLVPTEWWRAAVGVADLTPPGPGKTVTIVDTGVDLGHQEFVGRPNLVALNTQEPQPIGGVHGTEVASVVGASVNGIGMVGIYPEAQLQTWDVALGAGTELASSDIAAGILAAASTGPGVINLSVGADGIDLAIQQAIEMAIHKGMLVVAAAGNDGEDGSPLSYPASLPHVLTAAATDEQNQPASFSSRSRFVDLAAPGQDITVASALDDSWTTDAGTSFSSPLVAGAAAWVWTVRPELEASQLFEVMRRSATDIPPAGRDDATGFGLLNVPSALVFPTPVHGSVRAERRHRLRHPGRGLRHRHPRPRRLVRSGRRRWSHAWRRRGPARRLSRLRPGPRLDHGQDRVRSRRRPRPLGADDAERRRVEPGQGQARARQDGRCGRERHLREPGLREDPGPRP